MAHELQFALDGITPTIGEWVWTYVCNDSYRSNELYIVEILLCILVNNILISL